MGWFPKSVRIFPYSWVLLTCDQQTVEPAEPTYFVFCFFDLLKEEHWDKYKFAFGYKEEKFKRNINVLIFNDVQLGEQLAVIYSEC